MKNILFLVMGALFCTALTGSMQAGQYTTFSTNVARSVSGKDVAQAAQNVLQSAPTSMFGSAFNKFSFNAMSQGLDSAIKDVTPTLTKEISSGVRDTFYSLVTAIRPATVLPETIEKEVADSATQSVLSNPLASFALQTVLMMGVSFATARMDEQDQQELKEYGQKQVDASRNYDEFQKKLQVEQTKSLRQLGDAFVAAKKKVDESFALSGQRLQAEIAYLNRAVNLDKPVQQCLDSWIQWDMFFETSRMRTPSSVVWHNVFNVFNTDDWSYDNTHNKFWQNSITPWPQPVFWDLAADKRNLLNQDPGVHHIFTEYATDAGHYDIEIECTLIATQQPFFAGIVFNRGRWISGDPERLWWYRLLGIYGASETAGMMLDAAQLRMTSDAQGKRNLISPLEQIVKNNGLIKKKLDDSLVKLIKTDPITFIFRIANKPNACDVTVQYHTGDAAKTTPFYTGTISSLDDYLYRFHGIGFMAIGCQASFAIKKPEALVYSAAEREAFKKGK